jgi:PAS domain S-box-containing protein
MTDNGPPDDRDLEIQALREKVSQLEAAQKRLCETDLLYRSTIDAIVDGVHVIGPDCRIQLFNSSFAHWCERLGLSTDAVGQDLFSVFPFLLDRVREEYRQVMETGKALTTEESSTVGGEEIVTETRKIPLVEAGKVEHVLTIVRDITEHKGAEEALRTSEARYRALFESSRDAVVLLDGLSFIDCNDAALHLYGIATREELLNKAPSELSPPTQPDGRNSHEAEMALATETMANGAAHFEWRHVRPDGTEFDADILLSKVELKGKSILQGVVRDITEQKRAAAALQESEQRFRAIFDQAADGMLLADPKTMKFTLGNPAFCNMLGYSEDEIKTLGIPDIHPAESLARVVADFERQARSEATLAEDIPVKRKDGSVFLADVSAAQITLGGQPYLMGSFRDVTKRKQAERALRESEARYRTLVESAGEAIFTMNEEPRYLFMNSTAAERLGGRLEDFLGKTMWDVFPKEVADSQASIIQKAIRTGEGSLTESLTQIQGRPRWYQTTVEPLRDERGRVTSALVIARDITEREQAEQSYRAIIGASVDGLWIVDTEGRLLEVNSAVARMYGYPQEDMPGMAVTDLEAVETPEETAEHIRDIIRRGSDHFETRHRRKDGEIFDVEVSSSYLDIEGGRFLVFVRDITDRKRAEGEIQQARARLVTAREQERRRLARELHDSIGQSLVALQLTVQNAAATVREHLDTAQTAALVNATAQCTELIRDVRHICHGLYPPILESLGLVAGLRQLAQDVENAGITASVRCSKAIEQRRFSSDIEIALFRIAQEAVTNAIRHGECEQIVMALRRKRDEVHLTVEDDGVGFAPEQAVGSGLGLTHMRERAQAVGGTVTIRSKKGRTRVEAVLPDRPPGESSGLLPLVIDPLNE